MKLDHNDWVLLNAYVDGELDPSEQKRFSSRLAREPELQAEFESLQALKASLSGLGGVAASPAHSSASTVRGLAMVACLVLAVAVGGYWWMRPEPATTPSSLHSVLSAKDVSSMEVGLHDDGLDLSGSNLTLVDRMEADGTSGVIKAWHYRGPSGCALTLASGPGLTPGTGAMLRGWAVDGTGYVIVADGMDGPRFDAIAAYAEAQTRREPSTDDRLIAMQEKTSRAKNCA